jgi:gamma-glutamyltranspeptidase/glutathione hydrolase
MRRRFGTSGAILCLAALLPAASLPAARPIAAAGQVLDAGAVASPDRYGALAAREVLAAGGNAVDATVATAFALAVTYPEAGNLGGGGFLTLSIGGKPYFLDYRETAPAAARATMFLDAKGDPIAAESLIGNRAVAVPGTVRGMAMAHKRFGKLSWARDLAPAIRFARLGFVPAPDGVQRRDVAAKDYRGLDFDRYFGAMKRGVPFRQPELAATLERIAKGGDAEFYTGRTAGLIVAQMRQGPQAGLITAADLAGYRAKWRDPVVADWHGYRIVTAPPPSSGGVGLAQMLMMKADAAPLFRGVPLNSPHYVHLVSEIEKRVFADRARYFGDPDVVSVPVSRLIDPAYVARRAAEIDPAKQSALAAVTPGLEKPQTTHFSIVDKWGNAASNTYTLNGWYGAGVVVAGAGFLLNDEMDDFSAKPNAPNQFGVVGGHANSIQPGKRPLSSMSPSILMKDGKVAMVIGTPGGSRIFSSVFQVLVNVYDFHLPLAQALAVPRFHHQLLPKGVIFSEPKYPLPASLVSALRPLGYTVETQDFFGDVEAIEVDGRTPRPAADPRGSGVAMVVR